MGTEVLLPQDLLAERRNRAPTSLRRQRNFPANGNLTNLVVNRGPHNNNHNPWFNNKKSPRSDKRRSPDPKKSPNAVADSRRRDDVTNTGGFTLMRRGESYDSLASKNRSPNPSPRPARSPRNNGPESPPQMMPMKQIRLGSPIESPTTDVYAGSAFSLSPSPRSVPLPTFFNKKQQDEPACDDATRDLRRLLRLD